MSRLVQVVRAFTLVLWSSALFAQFDSGSITGTVTDPSGAPVPAAKITLVNTATGINLTTQSNEDGIYVFPTVRVGTFTMTAEKTGCSTASSDSVIVSVSTRTRVDLKLAVGQVS